MRRLVGVENCSRLSMGCQASSVQDKAVELLARQEAGYTAQSVERRLNLSPQSTQDRHAAENSMSRIVRGTIKSAPRPVESPIVVDRGEEDQAEVVFTEGFPVNGSIAHFARFFALGYSILVLRKTFGDSCLLVRSCRCKRGPLRHSTSPDYLRRMSQGRWRPRILAIGFMQWKTTCFLRRRPKAHHAKRLRLESRFP